MCPLVDMYLRLGANGSVSQLFGFKALRLLRLEDLRMPSALLKTFFGAPHGIQVERDRLNKYGRASWDDGRAVYE